jgi:DNA adenine methylase
MTPERPILRYHGGKWLLAPWILAHFPEHRVYVEPFGGGASVLLRKARSYGEVYNDLDGEIVNLFAVVRDRGAELVTALEMTPFARDEFRQAYEPSSDPVEQARRTLARSFMGFGSAAASGASTGFRANSNRSGTTPAHDWMNYPENIRAITDRLRGVVIENKDAIEVMLQHDTTETLHYVDPPYMAETRDKGSDYRHEMTTEQHRHMAECLHELAGMVVVSGYACKLYDADLFSSWLRVERPALADGARPRTEVLWMNEACAEKMKQVQEQLFA